MSDTLIDREDAWGRRLAAAPTTAISLIKRQLDDSSLLTFERRAPGSPVLWQVEHRQVKSKEGSRQ